MSETFTVDLGNTPASAPVVTDTTDNKQPEYTEIQLKAIDQGWIPKEEFDGDPSEFIDAPEFVRRGELFAKIDSQNKKLRRLEDALQAFSTHMTKVQEAEYNRALKALKDERKQAFVEGEHERAFQIEEQIESIETQKQQVVNVPKPPQTDNNEYTEMFQEWVSRNEWYESDRNMRRLADQIGKDYYDAGDSPAEVLKKVEREIKKEFAHKFSPKTQRGMAVEPSTRSGGSRADDFTMSAEEKAIMRKIVSVTPGYTEADYIRDLKKTR